MPKENNSEAPVVVGRRSARLSMIIPITIRGVDADGQAFKENTWTIGINKQGAKLATFHRLALGAEISIENPVLGRTAKALVIRVGEKHFAEDPYEIGVELTEAQNVWGVKFPPEDWQKVGTAKPGSRWPEAAPEPAPAPRPAKLLAPSPPRALPTAPPGLAPTPTPPEPAAHPEKFNQFNLAMTGLSRFAEQAQETAEAKPELVEEKLPKPANQAELQRPSGPQLQEAVDRLEEKEKLVRTLEQQLGTMADSLRASRAELESLMAKVQGLQQGWEAEVEKTRRNVQEATWMALQSAIEEFDGKLRKEMETVSSKYIEDTRKRIQEEAAPTVEDLSKQAGTRLAALTEEYLSKSVPELEARQTQATGQAKEQINQLIQTAAAEFTEKLKKMAEETVPSLRGEMEKSLETSARELVNRLTQSFQERARAASQTEASIFQQNLGKIQQQIQEEIADAGLKARQSCDLEAETARKNIAQGVDNGRNSIRLAAEDAVAKLQAAYQRIDSTSKAGMEDYTRRLSEVSASALEKSRHSAEDLIKGLQVELQKSLRDGQGKAAQEVSDQLQKAAEDLLEASTKQLHKQAEDALELWSEGLQSLGKELLEETRKQLLSVAQSTVDSTRREAQAASDNLKALGEALKTSAKGIAAETEKQLASVSQLSLGSLAQEARSASDNLKGLREELRTSGQGLVAETEKQLAAMTQVTLESLTRQAWTVAEDYRGQLNATLQEAQGGSIRELEAYLQKALEEKREAILKQLNQATDELSERAVAQIRSKAEQAAKEASDKVYKQVGVGAVVLKDWADQATSRIEGCFQSSVEALQKQVEDLSRSALERHRKESELLADELHNRLQQAARVLRDLTDEGPLPKPK